MMLIKRKGLFVQLQMSIAFLLLIDVIINSYGMPQSPVSSLWTKIKSQILLDADESHQVLPQSGAAVWKDTNADIVWMFGGQATITNKTHTLDHLWKLDLRTLNWTQIQKNGNKWPSHRHHAVLCSRGTALVLAGGVEMSDDTITNVWRYDMEAGMWEVEVGFEELLGNVTRFWCSGTDLFGLMQDGDDGTELLQYRWTHGSWNMVPTRTSSKEAQTEFVPELKNISIYPLWPSERGFVIIYAPTKNSLLTYNADWSKLSESECILWLLDKDIIWSPLQRNCHGNCQKASVPNGPGPLPSCRTLSGTWIDHNHNIWMHGGEYGTDVWQDTWTYNLKTNSWVYLEGACQGECQKSHTAHTDPITWTCNDTLFLFDGQQVQSNASIVLLWTMDISEFKDQAMLAVPPIGVFLISLSITFIISLGTCTIVILAKCSSPMAPRIRPPVRTYGKIRYSPVSSEEVS